MIVIQPDDLSSRAARPWREATRARSQHTCPVSSQARRVRSHFQHDVPSVTVFLPESGGSSVPSRPPCEAALLCANWSTTVFLASLSQDPAPAEHFFSQVHAPCHTPWRRDN